MHDRGEGFVACTRHHHCPADVPDEAHAVGHIRIGEDLDLVASEEWTEEPLADQRFGDVRPEQV